MNDEDLLIKSNYEELKENYLMLSGEDDFCVVLDTRQDENLKNKGVAREIINRV
jgi:hypothetical protein